MAAAVRGLKSGLTMGLHERSIWRRAWVVSAVVMVMFLAALVESGLWAATYLAVGSISGIEQALYFSTVTYTTLGFGDLVLDDRWRLLSSFEAANGVIIFGWSTALIFAAVQRVYFHDLDVAPPRA
jgi:hypothetical protein